MTKHLRVRTRTGWTTKPAPDLPENRLTAGEVDDNFLALEAAASPAFVVTGYGGVPDAAGSQLTAINAAAAAAAAAGGGRVILTPGTWNINGTVTLGNNVTLHLEAGATLFQLAASNSFLVTNADTVNGNTNVWVTGQGKLDGNRANQTTAYSVIGFVKCTDCGVIDVEVMGGKRTGTFPSVSSNGEGVEFIECDNCYMIRVRAHHNDYDGLKTRRCTNSVIANNRCWDNGRSGIQISMHSAGGPWSGTDIDTARSAGTVNYRCYNNRISHSTGTSSAAAPRTSGIYLHPASDGLIYGNHCTGTAQGFGAYGVCEDNIIQNNIFEGYEDCVHFEQSLQADNIVDGNDLIANGANTDYYHDAGARNIFRDNRCRAGSSASGTHVIRITGVDALIEYPVPDNTTVTNTGTGTVIRRHSDASAGTPALQTLTDAASIAWEMQPGSIATVTLEGSRILANPSVIQPGTYTLMVKQDATGSRTLSYGSAFSWPGGTAPTLTTTAGKVDILVFESDGETLFGRSFLNYTEDEAVVIVTGTEEFSGGPGGIPTDWTQRWSTTGVTWTEDAGGFLRAVKTTAGRTALSWNDTDASDDIEVLAKVRSSVFSDASTYPSVVLRGSGAAASESGYVFAIQTGVGVQRIGLFKYVGGVSTEIVSPVIKAMTTNTWYWIRCRANGTGLHMRFWADGDAEPGTWDISETDPSLSSGWAGVFGFSASTVDWDSFSYALSGGTAP